MHEWSHHALYVITCHYQAFVSVHCPSKALLNDEQHLTYYDASCWSPGLYGVPSWTQQGTFHQPSNLFFSRLMWYKRLSTALQILVFLPLTLATISNQAFLLLSLLLTIHSLIHGTMSLLWGSHALPVLQVPVHSFLLLVCFNIFSSSPNPYLITATEWWGTLLTLSGPLFITMEGLSSLLVVQKLGQEGKRLVSRGEVYQFGLLITTAVAYVASAWWIVNVRDHSTNVLCFLFHVFFLLF